MANQGSLPLLEKLKKAMCLSDFPSQNKIMVFREREDLQEIPKKYFNFKLGWSLRDNGITRYLIHDVSRDIIISLKDKEDYMNLKHLFYPLWQQIIFTGGLPLHSVLIEKEGSGVLLIAANSGGKSTASSLVSDQWEARADDLNIILPGRSDYFAFPFPTWSYFMHKKDRPGKRTWESQKSSRVRAIFFLEKNAEENCIEAIRGDEAIYRILRSVEELNQIDFKYQPRCYLRKLRKQIFENTWNLRNSVKYYTLKFNKKDQFCKKIEEVI